MIVKVKILNELAKMPFRQERKDGLKDFCYDIYATSCEEVAPNVYKYGVGLAFQIVREKADFEKGEFQVQKELNTLRCLSIRPRSSVWKTGMVLANSVPTIDEGYTGEVSLIFYHILPDMPKYKIGERIGQIYLDSAQEPYFIKVCELNKTDRQFGGFGSTGTI